MSTKAVKKAGRGRPPVLAPIITKHIVQLRTKTPNEFVEMIFPTAQPLMKGGVTDDPKIVKAQRTCLYQTVLREQRKAVALGKKVAFQGRKVNGEVKTRWIHKAKPVVA